jgi:hypothetical protein
MRLRVALATAVVGLALPALASADTYCVNKSPCLFGASKSTVQEALVAAAQNPGPDVVRIGARAEAYEGPVQLRRAGLQPGADHRRRAQPNRACCGNPRSPRTPAFTPGMARPRLFVM